MRTNQTWKVMLIAAGPAALACAGLGVVEFSDSRSLLIDMIGAYPVVLLAFLPGIPVLAFTLIRAFPCASHKSSEARVRMGWLAASWVAPWWHAGAVHLFLGKPLFDWQLVAEHSAILWFVTACGWLCVSRRPLASKREAGLEKSEPRRPLSAGPKPARESMNEPGDAWLQPAGVRLAALRQDFAAAEANCEDWEWNTNMTDPNRRQRRSGIVMKSAG